MKLVKKDCLSSVLRSLNAENRILILMQYNTACYFNTDSFCDIISSNLEIDSAKKDYFYWNYLRKFPINFEYFEFYN